LSSRHQVDRISLLSLTCQPLSLSLLNVTNGESTFEVEQMLQYAF